MALEIGAVDYIPRPFEPRELLARVRALARLLEKNHRARTMPLMAGWGIDQEGRILVPPAGPPIPLSLGEFNLLMALAVKPGRCLDREALTNLAGDRRESSETRTVDTRVRRLRNKLAAAGGSGLIETVRGGGYRFIGQLQRLAGSGAE